MAYLVCWDAAMLFGLFSMVFLGTAPPAARVATAVVPVCAPLPTADRLPAPGRAPEPGQRPGWPRSCADKEDDRDEKEPREASPFAGLALVPSAPRDLLRAPQQPPALASHPAVVPLIYALCTLLL